MVDLVYKRVSALMGCFFTSLGCGTLYVYSVYSTQLADRLGMTATQSSMIGLSGTVGLSLFGAAAGGLVDKMGPTFPIYIGAIGLFAGYATMANSYLHEIKNIWILAFACSTAGFSSSLAYFASIKTAVMNFPNSRGTATSIPLAAFGLSAFLFSSISGLFFSGDTFGFLRILALVTCLLCGISAPFVHAYATPQKQPENLLESRTASVLSFSDLQTMSRRASTIKKSNSSVRMFIEGGASTGSSGQASAGLISGFTSAGNSPRRGMFILGGESPRNRMYDGAESPRSRLGEIGESPRTKLLSGTNSMSYSTLAEENKQFKEANRPNKTESKLTSSILNAVASSSKALPSSSALKAPSHSNTSSPTTLITSSSSSPSKAAEEDPALSIANHAAQALLTTTHHITRKELVSNHEFWQHFIVLGLLSGTAQMYIYCCGYCVRALALKSNPDMSPSSLQSLQSFQVALISLLSFFGRLISGSLSDVITKYYGIQRLWLVSLSLLCALIGHVLGMYVSEPSYIWAISFFIGISYGLCFGVYPSIISESFGMHKFSQNWGLVAASPVFTSYAFNLLFGKIYDSNSSVKQSGSAVCELGVACYSEAFSISSFITFLTLLFVLFMTYANHKDMKEFLEEMRILEEEEGMIPIFPAI